MFYGLRDDLSQMQNFEMFRNLFSREAGVIPVEVFETRDRRNDVLCLNSFPVSGMETLSDLEDLH